MDSIEQSSRRFAALLIHDISNFNQTTRGYLEMLLDEQMGPLPGVQTRALATCLRQCHRIQSVLDTVRLLDHLEGKEPRLEALDLDQAIRGAISAVQTELSDRDIRVRFTAAGRMALAEPYLSDVLRQVIDNAARHNYSEIVEIDLQLRPMPRMWELRISDNGDGVPAVKRDLVFNRLKTATQGTGVGLSLATVLLERWGGEIRLEESPPGSGAVFVLTVPAAE